MLLSAVLAAAALFAPPSVGQTTFANLVRFSDVVVVAWVESVATESVAQDVRWDDLRRGGTARLGRLRVERWLKGAPGDGELVFLNQGTWTCDITGAEVGERAVFFLSAQSDDVLRAGIVDYAQRYGARPLHRVLHAGRGQMHLRSVAGEELATCWTDDVLLPEGAPRRPGPEPEYSFIESIPLDWLSREVASLATAQRAPQVRLEALAGATPGVPWRLTLNLDRTARLELGPPGAAEVREFLLDASAARGIDRALAETGDFLAVQALDAGPRDARDRRLVVRTADGDHVVALGALADCEAREARWAAKLWTAARASLDAPQAVDHRAADAPALD